MFSNSPRRILARTAPHSLSRRLLSAQQAQQALRPFYFAVHPDRFARTPEIRAKNEKSLQIFNGYLNELFPNRFDNKTPVEVNFSIDTGNGKLRDVSMSLSGSDPNRIVRMALEKCELSTSHVPEPPKQSLFEGFGAAATFSGPSDLNGMFDELLHRSPARRKRHAPVQTRNLFVGLVRNRDQALKNAESYENTKEALSTEVDFIIHRTGLKEIMWTMNWAHAHMRRSLIGLNRVLDQATPEHRETMIHAMNKRSLRFGRGGSFVCNDGGLQFGADDVPETWQQVCLEANVRRFQLRNLSESRKHLSHLFGGAQIIVANESNLLKTVDQFRSIIVRISARPKSDLKRIRSLSANTVIEITSAYDELALSRNGRLMVPCNVDVTALLEFLEACSDKAREVNKNAYQEQVQKIEVENLKDECCKELNLKSVSWEPEIARDALISCLRRLRDSKEEVRTSLQGLQVLISTNPNVYATADGEVSVPFDWL